MNRFIKLTFPRITLKYVYRRGKKRNKIKKVRLLNQKIFTGLFWHLSLGHFVVLSSFESFNGATPVVGFFLRVIKLDSRPYYT